MHQVQSDMPERLQHYRLYTAVFLVSAGLLMYELLLTRLFSVLIWYHFAFMAISLALLGLGASGLYVYLRRKRFPEDRLERAFAWYTFLAALSIPLALVLILWLNQTLDLRQTRWLLWRLGKIFALAGMPLLLGGIPIALALYLRGEDAGRVYGADLAGAALGALAVVPLARLMPVPQAMLVAAVLLALVPCVLASGNQRAIRLGLSLVACVVIVATAMAHDSFGLLHITHAKGREQNNLFEKWNAFSRVTVHEAKPFRGWAWSSKGATHPIPGQLEIQIDATDKTQITTFDGDLSRVEFLKYDITAIPYHLVSSRHVLNIGAGGGKDVLTALTFHPEQITAVELNPITAYEVMLGRYREFSGDLFRHPKVRLVVDEGRSFLRRTSAQFDIIQLTFTDTFAATSAGAMALAENTLYTVESFQELIQRLAPAGLLTITFMDRKKIDSQRVRFEAMEGGSRIVGIAAAALERMGVASPRDHLLVAKHPWNNSRKLRWWVPEVINIMVSRTPLTPQLIDAFHRLCHDLGFTAAVSPKQATDFQMEQLIDPQKRAAFLRFHPLDLSPTTDNRPFFLYQNKLKDAWRRLFDFSTRPTFGNGMHILISTLVISLVAVLVLLVLPTVVLAHRPLTINRWAMVSWLGYFSCLGAGFMLVEITLLQQFVLLLSYPIYTLAVSLTVLLVSTAMGSMLITRLPLAWSRTYGGLIPVTIAVVMLLYLGMHRWWIHLFVGYDLWLRIFATVVIIAPIGVILGMPMPLAIRQISGADAGLVPWGWAMNGATSVLGSGIAMGLSLHFGYRITLLTSIAVYVVAGMFFLIGARTQDVSGTEKDLTAIPLSERGM